MPSADIALCSLQLEQVTQFEVRSGRSAVQRVFTAQLSRLRREQQARP
jgi:hypothetical protein